MTMCELLKARRRLRAAVAIMATLWVILWLTYNH